jgi:hypothetical protein
MQREIGCERARCVKRKVGGRPIVRLNVGGKLFDTTPDTLSACPFFIQFLLGTEIGHSFDKDGRLFVDRNGDLFSHILQYLRSRRRPPKHVLDEHKSALLTECAFYCMYELAGSIRGELSILDLRPQDRAMRLEENFARAQLYRGDSDLLLNVHSMDCTPLPKEALQLQLLFIEKSIQRTVQGGFEDFVKQLDIFSGGLVASLRGTKHVVFAGGAVLGALTGTCTGDLDIFLTAPPGEALAVFQQIMLVVQQNHVRTPGSKSRILVTRSRNAVTFYRMCNDGGSPCLTAPPVQVILTLSSDIFDLLRRFDIDCCCMAWAADGDKVVCTPRGLRALRPVLAIAAIFISLSCGFCFGCCCC